MNCALFFDVDVEVIAEEVVVVAALAVGAEIVVVHIYHISY